MNRGPLWCIIGLKAVAVPAGHNLRGTVGNFWGTNRQKGTENGRTILRDTASKPLQNLTTPKLT